MSNIYGQISGQGPAVVLLHGFCETHHIWDELRQELSDTYQVFCPDLPGFGDSLLKIKNFSLEYIADELNDWLKVRQITSCIIIGHSLGGYVTLAFAKKYPDVVAKIGLFHSSIYEDDPLKKSTRDKTIDFINKNGMDAFVDSFFHNLFYAPNLSQPYIKKKLEAISARAKLLKTSAVNAYLTAMKNREDGRKWVSTGTKPVLFIAGSEDSAVPIALSREQAKLSPEIEFHELKGTGHMGMFERQFEAFGIIRKFLAD